MSGEQAIIGNRVTQLPRKTLLEKAREDLIECRRIMREEFHWCRASRNAMIDLLEAAISAAEEKNYDDNLYTTYLDITVLIQGWYYEDNLKARIAGTIREVRAGILARQLSEHAQLLEKNNELKRGFSALERANTLLERSLEEKSFTINLLNIALNDTKAKNADLIAQLEEEKRTSAQLREKLRNISGSKSEKQSESERESELKEEPTGRSSSPQFFQLAT